MRGTLQLMGDYDIVVIGGSAGSIDVLVNQIAPKLPADLDAAVFVVVHLPPRGKSYLAEILSRPANLAVTQASEGDEIQHGRIYVAPPDRHLFIGKDHIHLLRSPKEGLHRPSINFTFRSAAQNHDSRVIGVVLSGALDDGASGMWEIANRGGATIVQDPDDALHPSMPESALRDTRIDYTLPATRIAEVVDNLVKGGAVPQQHVPTPGVPVPPGERFSGLTCPECRGPVYLSNQGRPAEFSCRVGHKFSLGALLDEHTSAQERKLYEAIVALEEGADLAEYVSAHQPEQNREALTKEADQLRQHAVAIRKMIEDREVPKLA